MVNMFSDETIWRTVFSVIGGHIPLLIVTSFQIITSANNNIGASGKAGPPIMAVTSPKLTANRQPVSGNKSAREAAIRFQCYLSHIRAFSARRSRGPLAPRRFDRAERGPRCELGRTGLPPEKWSILRVRVSAICALEGAMNGTEKLHRRTDHRDAARGRGSAITGREDRRDLPRAERLGAELLPMASCMPGRWPAPFDPAQALPASI